MIILRKSDSSQFWFWNTSQNTEYIIGVFASLDSLSKHFMHVINLFLFVPKTFHTNLGHHWFICSTLQSILRSPFILQLQSNHDDKIITFLHSSPSYKILSDLARHNCRIISKIWPSWWATSQRRCYTVKFYKKKWYN